MDGLTQRQDRCLRIIDRYVKKEGRAPIRRELAEFLGQKITHGANQMLAALPKNAYVRIDPPGRARTIEVLRVPPRQLSLVRAPSPPASREQPGQANG